MQMQKAVLFDLDGTLLDTGPDLYAACTELTTLNDLPAIPYPEFIPLIAKGGKAILEHAFVGHNEDYISHLYTDYIKRYRATNFVRTKPYAGISEVLKQIRSLGLKWGIVTNKPGCLSEPLIATITDLGDAECIVSGDTTPFAKPHPGSLIYASQEIQVDNSNCLYVGDSECDVIAAKGASMSSIAVTFGYGGNWEEVKDWNADAIANSPKEILTWVLKWLNHK